MHTFQNENELLLRQIHPTFIQDGRISSQAFRPTPKDQKKLSANRNSMITAEESYKLHTENKKLLSGGVWAIAVYEVNEMKELSLKDDPIEAPIEDKSHCLIDFSQIDSESRIKAVGSKLSDKARERGCRYYPKLNK